MRNERYDNARKADFKLYGEVNMGARDRIRSFFVENVGKVLTTVQIRKVGGISEYGRRIRELRDEEGFQIKSLVDRADLKPGEYVLESLDRKPVLARTITPQLRSEILERNGFSCQLCGAGPGDPDPFNPNRKVRLHIDHIKPISQSGTDDRDNLRVLCSACNQVRSNVQPPSETALNVLAKIRKLSRTEQREIFDFLKRKFQTKEKKKVWTERFCWKFNGSASADKVIEFVK